MSNLQYSNERLIYNRFYRANMLYRINDLKRLWNRDDLAEYPIGCMLHLIDDNFLMNKPIVLVPDISGWSLNRRPDRKFVMHITEPVTGPMQFEEMFTLPQAGVVNTILNFKKRNQRMMRPVNKLESFPSLMRPEVQSVMSYNSLYRARIFGLLRQHRRFKYVFTSLFNMISTLGTERKHFIPIPVGNNVYDRGKFMMSFVKHDKGSLKASEDPWYLFMVHFLGWLNAENTPSLFEKIPTKLWPVINFVLYTRTKVLVLNMQIIKDFNPKNKILWRMLNLLNTMAEEGHQAAMQDFGDVPVVVDTQEDATELVVDADTPFEDERKEEIHVTVQRPAVSDRSEDQTSTPSAPAEDDHQEVVAPVVHEEPKAPTAPIASMFRRAKEEPKKEDIKPVKSAIDAKTTQDKIAKDKEDIEKYLDFEPATLTIDPKWLEVEMVEGKQNSPEFKGNMTKEEQKDSNKRLIEEIDSAATELIENDQQLKGNQVERVKKLATAYKDIKVEGKTIQQIITEVPDDQVASNNLEFLENDPDIIDKSMLKSSVNTFEHDYMKKMFTRDLVMNLTSFNKQGMFLKGVEQKDISDSLNQLTEYKATYEDSMKKVHTIRFKLPKVDERGYCYINGTLSVVKKQRVPLPICKVSPTAVNLTSNYNKYIITRNVTVAHSYINYIDTLLSKGNTTEHPVAVRLRTNTWETTTLPYEYTALARKYLGIRIEAKERTEFFFDLPNRYAWMKDQLQLLPDDLDTVKSIETDTKTLAVASVGKRHIGFIDVNNVFTIYNLDDHTTLATTTIIDYLCNLLGVAPTPLSEWVDLKLLNTVVPVAFALCYRYGLSAMLNYTKCKYRVLESGQRSYRNWSDTVIRFADKTLIIPRTPLVHSMIFAGLNMFKLNKINMEDMDSKDAYYDLLQSKKKSVHFLKGIDNFFDLFVDPVTREVLEQMKEPITPRDLLIRATQLLTTEDHKEQASSANFRFRSYELMNSAVYQVLSRSFSNYRSKSVGATHKWSIADYEVQQLVMQDQLKENVDIINPINDIKYQGEFSHAGRGGGRKSLDSFTVADRQFTEDSVGIVSEATVDSGKTGFAASTSMDPTIVNMRGMAVTAPPKDLKPTQMLSVSTLVMPATTQDDEHAVRYTRRGCARYRS